jgi:hypothetical protein
MAEDEAAVVAESTADQGPAEVVTDRLDGIRATSRTRWRVTLVAVVVGLGLVWLHWLGMVVGGALVALPRRSVRRGLTAGLGFGLVVVLANVLALLLVGPAAVEAAVSMQQVFGLSVVLPLAAGVVGGLVRGVV